MIPQQPGFGSQQQRPPNVRPVQAPLPMVQQGHPGQLPRGVPFQQGPRPSMQQQMLPIWHGYHYSFWHGFFDVSMPNMPGGWFSPYYMVGMPLPSRRLPPPTFQNSEIRTSVANAAPEHKKTLLGEFLYPLVEQLEPERTSKVTGMILELNPDEVLLLLETPMALQAKVAEAVEILRGLEVSQMQEDDLAALLPPLSPSDGV